MAASKEMPFPRLEGVHDFVVPLLPYSSRLLLADSAEESATSLQLFEALPISVSPSDEGSFVTDCVLYGGGLCSTLDWCPSSSPQDSSVEYFAVSCHSKDTQKTHIGSPVEGKGVVQIWSVATVAKEGAPLATMEMGLVHDGGVCYYLQWCPDSTPLLDNAALPYSFMGLLAMALGNGEVQVVAIPWPSEEWQFVRVEPWLRVTRQHLSGSLVSCLDWNTAVPYDLLLLGCWDGTVSVWALPCQERTQAQQLLQHRVDLLALRRVAWLKASSPVNAKEDAIFQHCFCSAGHSGHFKIWDMRNMFEPLLDWSLTRWWIMDADVSGQPLCAFLAFEDASVRQLPLEMTGFTNQLEQSIFHVYSGLNKGAIHAVCCSPCNALAAYGGEDGEIAVLTKENVGDTRYRKPHVCAGSMKYHAESDLVHVYTASQCKKIGGVYIGGAKFYLDKPKHKNQEEDDTGEDFQHQTIQCLRFSPNGNRTTWLAAGFANGFIRLIRITE